MYLMRHLVHIRRCHPCHWTNCCHHKAKRADPNSLRLGAANYHLLRCCFEYQVTCFYTEVHLEGVKFLKVKKGQIKSRWYEATVE